MYRIDPKLEPRRILTGPYATRHGQPYGAFNIQGPCQCMLHILATDGTDPDPQIAAWEHVSVSCDRKRPPNWEEMCFVKALFWTDEDCVVQFHPPKSDYINNHPGVLHLWRWKKGEFPRPPSITVGYKELNPETVTSLAF